MIGIICALKIEVDGLKALMENAAITKKAGLDFISGQIFEKDVVLLECGVGKVNAAVGTQIMIDLFHPEVIINSGIAGSLSKDLLIGEMGVQWDLITAGGIITIIPVCIMFFFAQKRLVAGLTAGAVKG